MKLIMLGSGTSTGVPRIGGADGRGDWGDCDPAEPRNRRSRVSIVVESKAGARLLVDTSPDLRAQLLANGIDRIDAVFWTHDHADHTHGIDDLRPMRYGRGAPLPGYGHEETVRRLRSRFGYVFAGQHGYHTICTIDTLDRLRLCAGFGVRWCQMDHGPAQSTAYRFDADGRSIGYATDFSAINREMVDLFDGCDLLVVDCLRREPHPTHAHLGMALELAAAARVGRAVLTHMDRSMDYAALGAEVPSHVLVGYDGLVLEA
ncbi:MBL fold metallo-hydrolase [Novosphingobium piscinae]|uniref:MBL fold metallo-hydrolase n=1 Tax=Novosphingobium piscinae TaxID=1507448 RepID=A0A7X1KQ94_9SPHN|nr:MBL fold metallo-hydrolase [Novosphingobium piscinae]